MKVLIILAILEGSLTNGEELLALTALIDLQYFFCRPISSRIPSQVCFIFEKF